MRFCTNCGKPIAGKFCSHCGTAQQQISQESANMQPDYYQPQQNYSQPQYGKQSQSAKAHAHDNRIPLNTNNEINETIELFGKCIRVSIIIRTIAIILCVFFFLPYFTTNYSYFWLGAGHQSKRTTYVTYELMTELNVRHDTIRGTIVNGSIFALLLILIPAALFAIYNFYKYIQFVKGKLFVVSRILSIAGLLINILYAIIITSSLFNIASGMVRQYGSVSNITYTHYYSFWFFLAIILYVWCSVVSFKFIKKSR